MMQYESFEMGQTMNQQDGFIPDNYLNMRQKQLAGPVYKAFKEKDLLKAANIYSQFDKKGNLYENRLYAKTSIN